MKKHFICFVINLSFKPSFLSLMVVAAHFIDLAMPKSGAAKE